MTSATPVRSQQQPMLDVLASFVAKSRRLVVLTGAGCSTDSGIPDYRDARGEWRRKPPVRFHEFLGSELTRKRYWARAMVGWRLVRDARPNPAHVALARLEAMGRLRVLITQNVDGLHQKAGSRNVIDLHGRIDRVRCLDCARNASRQEFQERLEALNPGWSIRSASYAPDGDADLDGVDYRKFRVPDCPACRGVLKPDVVFFGESVPRARVHRAMAGVDEADGLLVIGSSLMVWSGYRFVRQAALRAIPVAAVNLGRTRADAEIHLKVNTSCGPLLRELSERLGCR